MLDLFLILGLFDFWDKVSEALVPCHRGRTLNSSREAIAYIITVSILEFP